MPKNVIDARNLSKRFLLRHARPNHVKDHVLELVGARRRQPDQEFWALKNLSLRIAEGEAVGLVGRNGSGKSTLLRLIAGILTPTIGQLLVPRGVRMGTMIELGLGFHPELSARENLFMSAAIQGLTRGQTEAIYDRTVEYAGIGAFMETPLMNLSSGMQLRLGFSVAVHLDPDVLLLDEIFAVGDENFRQQCAGTMQEFRARGKTIIFVSHSPDAVLQICDRVCVLEDAHLFFDGNAREGMDRYHQLMASGASSAET